MLKIDRQKLIEKELNETGSIIISDLSKKLNCSEETIRRDLKEMEKSKKLKRIHGGAFLPELDDKGAPIKIRETILPKEKRCISNFVVTNLIKENDTIMLDCSTTCLSLAKTILDLDIKVTIITNSFRIISLFKDKTTSAKLIAVGGTFRIRSSSFVGYQTTDAISHYFADKSFISSSAISRKYGLLDNNQNEGEVRKAFLTHSKEHYLIADHTKFEDHANYIISPISEIHFIVTNKELSKEWTSLLTNLRIKIELACTEL